MSLIVYVKKYTIIVDETRSHMRTADDSKSIAVICATKMLYSLY